MNQVNLTPKQKSRPLQATGTLDQAIPKLVAPVVKTNKIIKFSKDGEDNETTLISSDTIDPIIDLTKVLERDLPYGKCGHVETKECADKKKNHMLQDDYFSSSVNKDTLIDMTKLPEYFVITPEEATKQVTEIFTAAIVDANKVERIRQTLNAFEKSNIKGPVNPLVSFDSVHFLINNNAKAVEQSFEEMKKEISMARFILDDGNSFFRSFMFGLFEHHILYSDLFALRKLTVGLSNKVSSKPLNRHNPDINYNEVMIILYLIIAEVESKRIREAYALLITAINQSKSFDRALIKYMKIALAEYIETNAELIFKTENWEEIETIAAPAYLSNHSFDYINYINDRVLAMDYEADKFLVQISPVVFRINLDLYAIEGTAGDAKHIAYIKQYFHCLGDLNFHNAISIFYSFARYHRLYSKESMEFHNTNITFRSKTTTFERERFKVIQSNVRCETCHESSDIICFNHIPRHNFCKHCLLKTIDLIITKRLSNFIEQYYNNKEYYFRFISLSDKFEDKIDEEDFIALFDRNIPQQMLYTMEQLCFRCYKSLGDGWQRMPCNCKLCSKCLIDNIMNATNQNIVLNQYEKVNNKNKEVKCSCGKKFEEQVAIDLVYQGQLPELERKANKRLEQIAEIICAFCGKMHEKAKYSKTISMNTNTVKNEYMAVVKFNINENDPTTANCGHILCKECIKNVRLEKENKIKRKEISEDATFYPLNCKVCLKTHKIEEKVLTEIKKHNACCVIY